MFPARVDHETRDRLRIDVACGARQGFAERSGIADTCRSSPAASGTKVLVRDLLSHTSGLPDMLPENTELRRAHAPLSEFVERTYKTPLLYSPGTSFRYQSMGILLAGAIEKESPACVCGIS